MLTCASATHLFPSGTPGVFIAGSTNENDVAHQVPRAKIGYQSRSPLNLQPNKDDDRKNYTVEWRECPGVRWSFQIAEKCGEVITATGLEVDAYNTANE